MIEREDIATSHIHSHSSIFIYVCVYVYLGRHGVRKVGKVSHADVSLHAVLLFEGSCAVLQLLLGA
jgi:hypothetical protein